MIRGLNFVDLEKFDVINPVVSIKKQFESYPQDSHVFILASLVNSVGSALMWPLTTIYVHNILHKSYGAAGFALLLQALAGIVGQFVGGALYHRVGAKRLIVSSLLLSGLAQFSLIFAKAWIAYLLVMTLNGFLFSVTMPAVNAFIGFRWPSQRYRLFNAVYVSNNIGVAIGTTLAGVLAVISFNLTFLFNSFTTIGFCVFFYIFLRRMNISELSDLSEGIVPQSNRGVLQMLRDYQVYVFMGLGLMMLYLCTSAWNSGVAPYLNQGGRSPAVYSLLWTINGIVILVGQPVTSLILRTLAKSLSSRLIWSAVLYALSFLVLVLLQGSYLYFIVAMIVGTLGEMLLSPTIPSLITQTTGHSAPFYLGAVGALGSVGRLVGPLLFGNLFDYKGLPPILEVALGAALCATLLFSVHRSVSERRVSEIEVNQSA